MRLRKLTFDSVLIVAALSKVWVYDFLLAGIADSNPPPPQDIDVGLL